MESAVASSSKRKVAYFYDEDVGSYAYNLVHPMKPHRIKMAHNLILNYGLDRKMDVLRPTRSTPHEMTKFHTDEYVDFLTRVSPETVEDMSGHGTRFLIGEDCPAFEGLFEFCSISAGGSISGARRLTAGKADIAINWAGGLHHAKKREASGFCYVNDIVLAILELLRFHARVLYIDIDIHHGDGVEEAFYTTDRVMTCSFHKFGDYFPGTGDLNDRGKGVGKGYAVNYPLKDGIDDESYRSVFRPTIQAIMERYRPGAVILQCGADSLAEDKLGVFNLSMKGHADCVAFVKSFNVPLVVVGGGGYTIRNVARAWAYETGVLVGEEMSENLPFNDYMEYYGPEFKLSVPMNNMENYNTREYLDKTTATVLEGLRNMPFAPSAQMQHVPYDQEDDEGDSDSDLDVRISQRLQQSSNPSRHNAYASSDSDDLTSVHSLSSRLLHRHQKSYITSSAGARKTAAYRLSRQMGIREMGEVDEDGCEIESRHGHGSGPGGARSKRTFFALPGALERKMTVRPSLGMGLPPPENFDEAGSVREGGSLSTYGGDTDMLGVASEREERASGNASDGGEWNEGTD